MTHSERRREAELTEYAFKLALDQAQSHLGLTRVEDIHVLRELYLRAHKRTLAIASMPKVPAESDLITTDMFRDVLAELEGSRPIEVLIFESPSDDLYAELHHVSAEAEDTLCLHMVVRDMKNDPDDVPAEAPPEDGPPEPEDDISFKDLV